MAETFLTLTNSVLSRMNEVQLTSSTFSSARGIQTQAQNAVNEAIRYINQHTFQPNEGDFYIFPADLNHFVNHFETNGERVSVSGNLKIKNERKNS